MSGHATLVACTQSPHHLLSVSPASDLVVPIRDHPDTTITDLYDPLPITEDDHEYQGSTEVVRYCAVRRSTTHTDYQMIHSHACYADEIDGTLDPFSIQPSRAPLGGTSFCLRSSW